MRPLTEAKRINSFNSEHLIREVKKREILWNSSTKGFLNRDLKRDLWEEVARVLNRDYEDFTPAEKEETVEALMRKWRNIRDYYIKEQKRNARAKSTGTTKKKKYNNYDLLYFLDPVLRQKRRSGRRGCRKDNSSDEDEMLEEYLEVPHSDDMSYDQYNCANSNESFSFNNSTSNNYRSTNEIKEETMTSIETQTIVPADVTLEEDKVKANKKFLLSLLPDISSLNERQNMRFRLGVLNLLNDIKFETN